MKNLFYWIVIFIDGLALLMCGLALVDFLPTLAIAGLFTPLRGRIQRSIDQRFFCQKYNAEQIIASFATTTRSEVKFEPLANALLNNVEETLHPEGIGLWLNATSNKK